MLEKWLKTLEDRKNKLLAAVVKLSSDRETIDLATKEIEINAKSTEDYLRELSEDGFSVQEDLKEDRELYNVNEHYRHITNHINNHMFRMNRTIEQLRKGTFEAEFGRYY